MGDDRWSEVEKLYHAVLEREPSERAAFLDQCANEEVRREVQSLLQYEQDAQRLIDHGDIGSGATLTQESPRVEIGLRSIGEYHLLQKVGEGGLGEVWLAEQKVPVRRRVALKLIKAGMDSREVAVRFESERQALALMDHPAIAKVFDGGSTTEGRPYFVMEYVPGIPITDYCDKHKLGIEERLELFMHVCEGVQHAHQKAIIHRDLKPSNILVTEVDGKPVPKIIDFGVAKATAQRLTAETMLTRVGTVIGTLEYMSPEQADTAGEDIDTRTDVYSLGVVLYELLVGALPLEFDKLSFPELLNKLREEDAPRPSTKARTSSDQSTTAARNRRIDPPTLSRRLSGDLDAITLKALEKERSRRYSTPVDLAADIGRYLRNEPVLARPASAAYRARKYVRRHRASVAVGVIGILLLITFGISQTLQLRRTINERNRANEERSRANRERDRASRITEFMTNMFNMSDPSEARGNTVTAREILDKASKDIETGLAMDPELQAQLVYVMADVYQRLGMDTRAEPLAKRAVDIQRHVYGFSNPETLKSMKLLGLVLRDEGYYVEAEKVLRATVDVARRVLGPQHEFTLRSMNVLGVDLMNEARYGEAENLDRQALEISRRSLGPEHTETLLSMQNLAADLMLEGRYAEAEKLNREAVDIVRQTHGPEHALTLVSMLNVAMVLNSEGRFAESEKLDREVLEIRQRVLGPEHPDTVNSMCNLATDLAGQGHYVEARKLLLEARSIQARIGGPDHPITAVLTVDLGLIAAQTGHVDEAFKLLREAIDHGLAPQHLLSLDKDKDVEPLRRDPRFAALIAHAKERAAATPKPH